MSRKTTQARIAAINGIQLDEAFTRQHYVAIAEIIKRAVNADNPDRVIETIAEELADLFKRDNSSFDKGRFLTACGL